MSSLEGNKIAAAVLVSGITAMLAGFVSEVVFGHHEPAEDAYPIAATLADTAVAVVEAVPLTRDEILALIAGADAMKGERVAKKCVSCHTFTQGGKAGIGPNLWNVVNQPVARFDEFEYSNAFEDFADAGDAVWDYESLFHFFEAPRKYIKGTKMSFIGLSKEQDRADVIEYLRQLSDSPAPIE
ncbi:MAG: cytochrome c family protein [Alphaproteobacteria bacterium]|nr:cytochrome c family protein [Alphaproteobacteria bacterium]MDA8004920.1 cytochrome c family protein [Alphaproteobacteria bacterium]MDA8006016.1 cytochrome c family protein [Alphaproteobacteria bacterium]MDA8013762.1 cytochrome c family protein [Alphaproteobacteria bacterium]